MKRTLLCALIVCAALAGCRPKAAGPALGALAPDFVLPRLDGTVQKLSNYRGKVVLVNFWATRKGCASFSKTIPSPSTCCST